VSNSLDMELRLWIRLYVTHWYKLHILINAVSLRQRHKFIYGVDSHRWS